MKTTAQRGSALLTAVVVIMVITVIGIGLIRVASREVAGAYAGAHQQSLIACADAAQAQLLSKFRALGFQPSQLQALNLPLGTTLASARTFAVGGHYDTPVGNIVIEQVTYLPETSFGPASDGARPERRLVAHRPGRPARSRWWSTARRATVGGGRQLEVEFGIRFGL